MGGGEGSGVGSGNREEEEEEEGGGPVVARGDQKAPRGKAGGRPSSDESRNSVTSSRL